MANFPNSRADNSDSSGPIRSIIELIRDFMITYILTKSGVDWLIFVDARSSGSIYPIIDLIRDLMGIYVVANFGTDWSIFADARL